MKIVGYQGVSLIDFPGHIATVLFAPGCNFLCPYCQNPDLVQRNNNLPPASPKEVHDLLTTRKGFIDGVSVTGGEPTLQNDLLDFLRELKELGLAIKLDTNGYLPKVLKRVLESNLADFVAMDIKSSFAHYEKAAGCPVDLTRLDQSIDLLMDSGINYEFRTTVVPGYVSEEDVMEIARRIAGAKSYRLHQFSNKTTLDSSLQTIKPMKPELLHKLAEEVRAFVADTKVRGI